jgi:hypothetical protein
VIHDGRSVYNVTLRRIRVNVYSSSSVSTVWYCFNRRERFCDDLAPSATMKHASLSCFNNHYVCLILAKFGFSRQVDIEFPNIKFHENPSSEICADTCRETDGQIDGWTVMTQVTDAFRDCAKALVKGT